MNNTIRSRTRHYITKVGLSLLILALIAGMTGCAAGASRPVRYDLTIASAQGGSVDEPGEGTFTCDAGRIVDLSAIPTSGYRFVNWTGDVDTINNPYAASTSITVNDDYSITANFEQTAAPYYTLTMAVTGSGSTSPSVGQHTRAAGAVLSISATAASGYHFVRWTAPAGSFGNTNAAETTFTMPGQDVTVTAHFEVAVPYTLTMAVTGSGSTSPAVGQHTYTAGTIVQISASPASGYYFSHWTATVGSFANANAPTTTFTMPAQDVTVTAHFEEGPPVPPDEHTLTMAVTGSGSTSPAVGQHTYTAGTIVQISASPASGYYFSHWTATVGSFANANAPTTTFTMPAQDVTVTAHFDVVPPGQYTLTLVASPITGGTVSDLTGTSPYTQGESVIIKAVAASGYQFAGWTAPAGSFANANAATTTFTMPAQDVTVTAHFDVVPPGQYTLTLMASPITGGTVSDLTGTSPYTQGESVTIKAVAVSGYQFAGWTAPAGSFSNANAATTTFTMPGQDVTVTAHFEETGVTFMVAAGERHTVGLNSDGTVVAVGDNGHGQCNVGGWTNIIQVAAGDYRTVGLKYNGAVVAVGANDHGECNVGAWTNIVQVSTGAYHTVGLRSNGTVVAVGDNEYGQCNVGDWTNIIQVSAGLYHTVGLKSDGTVVAVGYNANGECNVGGWTSIIQVAAGGYHTVGVKFNGTVVAVGDNDHGQCNVGGWTNIIQVAAGWYHTAGTESDGTVVAVGANWWEMCNVGSWTNIIQVSAGLGHTVGLKWDGTVIAVGANWWGECRVGDWDLN